MIDSIEKIELEKKGSIPPAIFPGELIPLFENPKQSSSIHPIKEPSNLVHNSKPVLDSPNPIWKTFQNNENLEKHSKFHAAYKEKEIDNYFDQMQKFEIEEAKQLQEANKIANRVCFWEILDDITASISSSVSLFMGLSTLSTGSAAIGGALVVSGIFSLTNVALRHAHIWDWIAQQIGDQNETLYKGISTYLPSAIGICAGAMGVYGVYSSQALSGAKQILSIFQTAATLASGFSGFGRGWSSSQQKKIEGALTTLQSNSNLLAADMDEAIIGLQMFYQQHLKSQELASKLTQAIEQSMQITQQPV